MKEASEARHGLLAGRIALLTNADQGVGMAVARELARNGARLAVTLHSPEEERALRAAVEPFGARVAVHRMPAKPVAEDVARFVRAVVSDLGPFDILIANSDHPQQWQVDDEDVNEEALDRQFECHVKAVTMLIRAAAKVMRPGGRIITIGASLADRVGTPGLADLAATRAAVAAFCKGVAHDLGPRGITINVVQLGAIELPHLQIGSELAEAERQSTALKRLGRPEEVAQGILFLAGPGASFITGSVLNIDGGYNA